MLDPVILSVIAIALSAFVTRRLIGGNHPFPLAIDVAPFVLGFIGMLISDGMQTAPASTWSLFIDLGSFAIGTSLVVASPPGSWPRTVGGFILGIHAGQVLVTNAGAPFA